MMEDEKIVDVEDEVGCAIRKSEERKQTLLLKSAASNKKKNQNGSNNNKNNVDDSNGESVFFNQLLDVAATLIEKDESIGADQTGLVKALRELAIVSPLDRPKDPSTWLSNRLRDYRPTHALVPYQESVLEKGLVMKCDEFANIHILRTSKPHPQVWNFRKCDDDDLHIYGVGQCHVDGLEFLLQSFKKDGRYHTVKWFNMREEPVVFLDGQACAPRMEGKMNDNVEYLMGIEGYELDSMELRLCSDCKDVAKSNELRTIDVYYQTVTGDNERRQLQPLSSKNVFKKTFSIRTGYEWLSKRPGVVNNVEYYRIPIADETAPEEKDFDQLIAEMRKCFFLQQKKGHDGVALVFNCQMGRGRTTTGMVSACIMSKAVKRVRDRKKNRESRAMFQSSKQASVMQQCLAMNEKINSAAAAASSSESRNKKRGEYLSILTLLDMIDVACAGKESCTGEEAKMLADECIDSCAHACNMVEAIDACIASGEKAELGTVRSPEFWHARAHNYLERYAYIVLFAAYALDNAATDFRTNFTDWCRQYWHFKRVMKHLTLD